MHYHNNTSSIQELRLMTKVARMYYEQGFQQNNIADRLGLSQAKISRLLKKAQQTGVIRITVNVPTGVYTEMETHLEQCFDIKDVIVADCDIPDDEEIYLSIGKAAAYYLETKLQQGDIIGISSWSASLLAMVDSMHPLQNIKNTSVVQILGGVGNPSAEAHATHLTQKLASLVRGEAIFLPAAGVVSTPEKKDVFLEDPYVKKAVGMFDEVTIALVGIGAIDPSPLLASSGNTFSSDELQALRKEGAIGDICMRFFDINGQAINSYLNDRVIGIPLEKIKKVKRSVGIAGGLRKVDAILAALRGKLINVLVTDRFTAEKLLTFV